MISSVTYVHRPGQQEFHGFPQGIRSVCKYDSHRPRRGRSETWPVLSSHRPITGAGKATSDDVVGTQRHYPCSPWASLSNSTLQLQRQLATSAPSFFFLPLETGAWTNKARRHLPLNRSIVLPHLLPALHFCTHTRLHNPRTIAHPKPAQDDSVLQLGEHTSDVICNGRQLADNA